MSSLEWLYFSIMRKWTLIEFKHLHYSFANDFSSLAILTIHPSF